MTVSPTTDELFSRFSPEDRIFLQNFFSRHPEVGDNFVRYLQMPAQTRQQAADDDIKQIGWRGWVLRRVKDPETIHDHLVGVAAFVEKELADYPEKMGLSGKKADDLRADMIEMARVHDLHEAITTGFSPHDRIPAADRKKVELLAAKVVFEHFPQQSALTEEFMQKQTARAQVVYDFDKLYALMMADKIEKEQPSLKGRILPEFLSDARKKIKTPEGKEHLMNMFSQVRQNAILLAGRSR